MKAEKVDSKPVLTYPISIRFEADLLAEIKVQAEKVGIPYQTWIKMILHQELKRASRRKTAAEG